MTTTTKHRHHQAQRLILIVLTVYMGLRATPVAAAEIPWGPTQIVIGTFDGASAVTAADIDGDGTMDLAGAAMNSSGTVRVWFNTAGDGSTWTSIVVVDTGLPGVHNIRAADIDGDGDTDLVGAATGVPANVIWWENTARDGSTWTRHTMSISLQVSLGLGWITLGNGDFEALSAEAVDMDGDGDLDIVGTGRTTAGWLTPFAAVVWWANESGDGSAWSTMQVISQELSPASPIIHAADGDGDGDTDIIGTDTGANLVWWANNGSGGGWARYTIEDAPPAILQITTGDIDRDGDLDIIAPTGDAAAPITWWAGDGSPIDGGWVRNTIPTSVSSVQYLTVADIDHDGDLDVSGAASVDGEVLWWENNGAGWTEHEISTLAGAQSIVTADIDRDGDMDLAAAAGTAGTIAWWENKTIHRNAVFSTRPSLATETRDFDTADMDRDGDVDIVGVRYLVDDEDYITARDAVVWENSAGDGSAWIEHIIESNLDDDYVYTVDMDSDGDTDLLAMNRYDDHVTWWQNDGTWPDDGTPWAQVTVSAAFSQITDLSIADIDGDGDPDLLCLDDANLSLIWAENANGLGTAWIEHPVANSGSLSATFRRLAAADIDGNGSLDIVYAVPSSDHSLYITIWRSNSGDGLSWSLPNYIYDTTSLEFISPTDLDGDGDMDVVGVTLDGQPVWAENDNGSGTGWVHHTLPGDDIKGPIKAVDIDTDGDIDLLGFENEFDAEFTWWENTGDPDTWIVHTPLDTLLDTSLAAIADVDADGDLDIVGPAPGVGLQWWDNVGGQFSLDTENTAPDIIAGGTMDDILAITPHHLGRAGDTDIELATLALRFEYEYGDPLTTDQANALIAHLRIYRDDGSGHFEATADTQVADIAALDLSGGVQTVTFADDDPNLAVAYGTQPTFFVVIEMADDAVLQDPIRLRVTHLPFPTGTAKDRDHNLTLVQAPGEDVTSGVVGAGARTLYLAPDTVTCAGNMPCLTRAHRVLETVLEGGTLVVLGSNEITSTLTGTGRAITITAADDGTLDWRGGAGTLLSFDSEPATLTGTLTLVCTTDCGGATAIRQTGNAVTVATITMDGFTTAINQSAGNLTVYSTTLTHTVTAFDIAAGAVLTAHHNTLSGTGTAFRNDGSDLIYGNTVAGFATVADVAGGELTAFANNFSDYTTALARTGGTATLVHNWWGGAFLPDIPAGLDPWTWYRRLGAPVQQVAHGDGSATLGLAELSGGSGTAVIVSHGRGPENAPFGNGSTPADEMCSDYYDFFTVGGSGSWTVRLPFDYDPIVQPQDQPCLRTWYYQKSYWALDLTQCAISGDPDCWDLMPASDDDYDEANKIARLVFPGIATEFLMGTPITAGSKTGDGPTAVVLQMLVAQPGSRILAGAVVALGWCGAVGIAATGGRRLLKHRHDG